MMRNHRKYWMCLLIFVLIVSMTGCDQAGQNQKSENDQKVPASVEQTKPLLVFSGAGLKKPMDEIGKLFEEKYGIAIQYTYAGAGQNIAQMSLTDEGDVFVPGDISFYESAKEKELVDSKKDIAYHIPIIIVPADNPANIQSLEDLAKPDIKIVFSDPESAPIGKISMKIFEKIGLTDQIKKNIIAMTPTVNELVTYISMKQADASIVWEDNAKDITDIKTIEIPKEKNMIKTVPISLITQSKNKESAQKYIDFVVSDEGKAIFQKHGFKTID